MHTINQWCSAAYAFEAPPVWKPWKPWRFLLLTTTFAAHFSGDWPAGFVYKRLFSLNGQMPEESSHNCRVPLDHAGHGASSQEPPPYEVGRSHLLRWE
ncbi:hypothetical protein KVR01_005986 [Diaporthe batatas]|uniref:uncharacterized protein n=1 Tax=Diaporthe batatas TaxID=748121 RepID=UPI001D03F3CF|nr:uncharacterized protein KVR01_005986 [Diaporthe batatas]KAG8164068.1 hypothetical protein KVR01_005986 [Diaporthe batatas]